MRLYIVSAVFPPEPLTSAQTSCDIATEMTRRGHDVTVFAPFPNRPTGRLMKGRHRAWRAVERRDGYRIIHSWHSLSRRPTLLSRLTENITFGLSSTWQLSREAKPDVVFLNTWPLFSQWLNTWHLSRRNIPVVCAVKDLYPESYLGSTRAPVAWLIARLALGTDAGTYSRSRLVVPLNRTMADHIVTSRGVSVEDVRVVSDWVDTSRIPAEQPKQGRFRRSLKLSDETFVALHAGSMTLTAGLQIYVEAAAQLRDRPDIHILIVGDGVMRKELEHTRALRGLKNISIVSPLRPQDVPDVHAAADVLLLTLSPGAGVHATPSKLISYLFSERPVVASVSSLSESARIIQEADCGYVTQPGDSVGLASLLAELARDRNSLDGLGKRARRYAERHYSRDAVLPGLCDALEQVAGESVCAPG